jgi:hypothetical protein
LLYFLVLAPLSHTVGKSQEEPTNHANPRRTASEGEQSARQTGQGAATSTPGQERTEESVQIHFVLVLLVLMDCLCFFFLFFLNLISLFFRFLSFSSGLIWQRSFVSLFLVLP